MRCSKCNEVVNTRLILGMCSRCYQRERANSKKKVYPLPKKGEVAYAPDGTVICHICGRSYNKVLAHVWQVHNMTEKEYKDEFDLIHRNGLVSESTKVKLQKAVVDNYDKVVTDNLVNGGKSTRFKSGEVQGKSRRVSLEEKRRLHIHIRQIGHGRKVDDNKY